MAFQPNEEQQEFLQSEKCNVLVSASAGSGKTSTMIQKLMQIIIKDKVPIGKLLVLTFTDSASAEIKQRLFAEISDKLSTAEENERKFLKEQLDNINSAEIGTLHSVCKKLIVKYFYEINESPDFSMLSDKESKYLIDYSISSVFEKHIKSKDEKFFELYESYNAKRSDVTLKKMILTLLNYLRNKCDYRTWINDCLTKSFDTDLNKNEVCSFLHEYAKSQVFEYIAKLDKCISLCKQANLDKYIKFLYPKKQFIEELLQTNNFLQCVKVLFNSITIKKPSRSSKADAIELDIDEQVDKLNKQINETIKNLKVIFISGEEDTLKGNLETSKSNVLKLMEIVEEIGEEYASLKKNKNVLDFNDLEDKMLELLQNEDIRKILKENYQFVFFDEYQDINEKQEMILSYLVSGDNYYMIGDVKQSIYAFRQSSPKIFVNKFYDFSLDGGKNKVINFNKNYRSDRNILEFDNLIFDNLITDKTIGIDYSKNSRFQSNKEFKNCNVQMTIIDTKKEEENSDEEITLEEKEAMVVANAISELLSKKKEDGSYFSYRDIAIILRKRGTFVKTLCDVLTSMQIPLNTVVSSDFFSTSEINLMVAITKVLSNFKEDISLSVVLKNLFEVSDQELFDIRKNSESVNFYDCVISFGGDKIIKNKLDNFFCFLNDMRKYLSMHTTNESLQEVIRRFDLLTHLKSTQNGIEKVNNIEEFLRLSDNDNYKYNIDKFVDYLEFVSKEPQLQKIGNSGNAVQIMTIHYSKGLEFPAVIFAGLGKKFNINKDTNDIIINEKFGFGLKCIDVENRTLDETLIRNACKIDNKKSELNEEIRLLYVAMTRPKEKLILIGSYDLESIRKNREKDLYFSKNYLDMILRAVPNLYISNFESGRDFILNDNQSSCAKINFLKLDDIYEKSLKQNYDITIVEPNKNYLDKLKYTLEYAPTTITSTIKNTVTNILSEEKDYEIINNRPNILDYKDKVESKDFLKIGTAYHSVMQNLNFTETKQEIEEIIKNLHSKKIIGDEITEIKIEEIWQAKENLKDLILNAQKVYKEKQFVMQQNYNKIVKNSDNNTKVIVQGIIDLVVVKDGEAILIDYKTNRTKDTNLLAQNYALQLEIYKQAFEKATNIAINKKFLYSFYLGKLIEVI